MYNNPVYKTNINLKQMQRDYSIPHMAGRNSEGDVTMPFAHVATTLGRDADEDWV